MAKKLLNVKLSSQAYVTAIAYIVMAVVILLPFNVSPALDSEIASTISQRYVFTERLVLVLLMLIPMGLSIYSINCFVVGKCLVWSWIHAILVIFWVLLFVIAAGVMSRTPDDTEQFGTSGKSSRSGKNLNVKTQ